MARRSWHDRVFARLLRMFPAEFRGDFGQAMADDFRDQREDAARTGGQRSLLRVWLLTLGGSCAVRRASTWTFSAAMPAMHCGCCAGGPHSRPRRS